MLCEFPGGFDECLSRVPGEIPCQHPPPLTTVFWTEFLGGEKALSKIPGVQKAVVGRVLAWVVVILLEPGDSQIKEPKSGMVFPGAIRFLLPTGLSPRVPTN